jgi:thiol-disulfide isomerase/thioredoxin
VHKLKKKITKTVIIIGAVLIALYLGKRISYEVKADEAMEKMSSKQNLNISSLDMDLNLKNKKGEKIILTKELKDKGQADSHFIVFFSPTCKPCLQEIKMLNQFADDNTLKKEPILIGIGEYKKINDLIDENNILLDYYSIDLSEFKEKVKENAVPLSLVVNGKGELLFGKKGWSDDKDTVDLFTKKINSYK